jgi:hypothetical protein
LGSEDKSVREALKMSFSNLKWWQATIMVVLILLASGFAAHEGVSMTVNLSLDARLQRLEDQVNIPVNSTISAMIKEANYIVSSHDVSGTAYYCLVNGTDDRAGRLEFYNTNKTLVQQFAIGNLTAVGGTAYLKQVTLNTSLTYGANVLIIEDYQGKMTFYRDNTRLRELADPTASMISGTFTHPNSAAEQTLITFTITTPTVVHELTLDFSNLTQNTIIRVYKKIGADWKLLLGRTLNWETTMDDAIPLGTISSITDTKITIQSADLEGTSRNIAYSGWKEVWS